MRPRDRPSSSEFWPILLIPVEIILSSGTATQQFADELRVCPTPKGVKCKVKEISYILNSINTTKSSAKNGK